jgi:hypothetical protein
VHPQNAARQYPAQLGQPLIRGHEMRREAAFAAHAATIMLAAHSMAALHTGEFEFCMVASVQRPTQSGGGTEGEKPVGRAERDN